MIEYFFKLRILSRVWLLNIIFLLGVFLTFESWVMKYFLNLEYFLKSGDGIFSGVGL